LWTTSTNAPRSVICIMPWRRDAAEVMVFDSTGVAIEDVAAAAVAWERAEAQGIGSEIALGG
jgi:ornithine cyclodeaminase/alanine dehydrogenase-like protein (mu-crystallin family)